MRSDFNIDHEEFIDSTNCVFDAVESKDERVTANRHKRIRENAKECYLNLTTSNFTTLRTLSTDSLSSVTIIQAYHIYTNFKSIDT
ncbi:unnamed protein product, partial [Rotaria socialis]